MVYLWLPFGATVSYLLKVTAAADSSNESIAFWQGDERFYIRGVAYQPGGAAGAQDPLLDMEGLRRDVERFRELGINTIRKELGSFSEQDSSDRT